MPALLQALWFAALGATVIGELLPGNSMPMRWVAATHINDKTLHFTAYAVLAFLPVFGYRMRRGIPVAASMILLGVVLEFAQRLVPSRSFEVADMMANALGVLTGMTLALVGQAWMARVEA
jgi:VanZ family protein